MTTDSDPITVTISHRLGREEAKRRIDNGLGTIRAEIGAYVKSLEYGWTEYTLDFRGSALLQTIAGRIDVHDDFVRVELSLPRLLHMIARPLVGRIEQRATTLLEGPKPG